MGKKKDGESGATSNNVYILDKEFAWMPARLVEQAGDSAKVSVPQYEEEEKILCDGGKGAKSWKEQTVKLKFYPGKALPLQNVDKAGCLIEKEDMVDLPFLHEVRLTLACSRSCCLLWGRASLALLRNDPALLLLLLPMANLGHSTTGASNCFLTVTSQ